jgi:hypothetical protein
MATLMSRISQIFKKAPQEVTSATMSAAVRQTMDDTESIWEQLKADRERMAVVKTCRLMYDTDPRIEKAHRFYARDIVRAGFIVKTKDEQAKQICADLQTRLDLNQVLEDAVRETSRDGDSFYEVVVSEEMLITELSRKPTLQTRRNSNTKDKFDQPAKAFYIAPSTWMGGEPPANAIWFAEWQMLHARWNHDQEKRYGKPMFGSATGAFKRVEDGELNVAVRRKIGGAQIRQHVIEGSPADVEKYKENNKATLGKLAAVIDFFSNKASSLTIHQGDGNIDKIGDINHHVATMMAASDVPMELIVYGESLNRDILGEKKEEYEETLSQGREWLTAQIVKPLLERQWLLMGILPASVKYEIVWRTAKPLTPMDLRDLADGLARLRVLGVKEEVIQAIAAMYLRNVDDEIMNGDGFSAEQFAQNIKGISI